MTAIKETDSLSGIETIYHVENGNVAIERKHDTQSVLDSIRTIKDTTGGISASGDLHHVARIPGIIIEAYCNRRGISFHDFMVDDSHITTILNDPDYAFLRIKEGRA